MREKTRLPSESNALLKTFCFTNLSFALKYLHELEAWLPARSILLLSTSFLSFKAFQAHWSAVHRELPLRFSFFPSQRPQQHCPSSQKHLPARCTNLCASQSYPHVCTVTSKALQSGAGLELFPEIHHLAHQLHYPETWPQLFFTELHSTTQS